MKFISYTDRRGRDCRMWTRVTYMYNEDSPEIEILAMREDELVPYGCWEDKKFNSKEEADRQILDWARHGMETSWIRNLEVH